MKTSFPLAIRQPVRRYVQLRHPLDTPGLPTIRIKHVGGLTLAGYTTDGQMWAPFEVDWFRDLTFSKRGARHCAICGEWIVVGYSSGFIGSEISVCCRHIEWVR